MRNMNRKEFLQKSALAGAGLVLSPHISLWARNNSAYGTAVNISEIKNGEDLFAYIQRRAGGMDLKLYRQLIGAANDFKEGDASLGLNAADDNSRSRARMLLINTRIGDIDTHSIFTDRLSQLIQSGKDAETFSQIKDWTFGDLKKFVLEKPQQKIKELMPGLSSDVIACLVKLMSNDELTAVGQKVFNPLPDSNIGAKGYMSARVQPNSPTDHIDDIVWQVFSAWSYAVGDLVLGTNPVSSTVESVSAIELALYDLITTFNLEDTLPNCVLSHIDVQAQAEALHPGTTGIWFQSLAGTDKANETFDLSIEKMLDHASERTGKYGLYAETGQGADFTNGHGEGFDMLVHESRKYGFLRALKQSIEGESGKNAWVHLNDVAGFIGPEVFKTREQLVRCCLEDIAMGKLHGLAIGLDVCSTLHMDVTLDDLDWCIDQIMPANPAYLMALPTKNDPMLSYLTTAFNNHVAIREKFGYKVNDAMWDFFKRIEVIDDRGQPTEHFGDPKWVFYQYCKAKNDPRTQKEIYLQGEKLLRDIKHRGVPVARGYGNNIWDLEPGLEKEMRRLYEDAKISLWTEMTEEFVQSIPSPVFMETSSTSRKDYVYHPPTGEALSPKATDTLNRMRDGWGQGPDVQIIISDGLNAKALMDDGHLKPYLEYLSKELKTAGYRVAGEHIVLRNGRVRAGYRCGELLFSRTTNTGQHKGVIHIIGERPGSGHHNFSAYLSAPEVSTWSVAGKVDHNISKVVSGISDTALSPEKAAKETAVIFEKMFNEGI